MFRRLIERVRFAADHRWSRPRMSAYLDKDLTRSGRERLERHVHDCERCREILESLRATIASLRGLRADPGPEPTVAPEVLAGFRERQDDGGDDGRLD